MITSATPSQVSITVAPAVQPTFTADNQQTVFKPLVPVMKSDAMAAGDKERHISSPMSREVAASGYTQGTVQSLVTYNKEGRLTGAGASVDGRNGSPADDAPGRKEEGNTAANDSRGVAAEGRERAAKAEIEEQKQQEIRVLAARDREVRAHEQAHAAVGGAFAGAPKYQFERGPDGVNYAVGGEVPIDVSPAATPEATIAKMQAVRRAALAPAEPSPQDRRVAQEAIAAEARARQEVLQDQAVDSNVSTDVASDAASQETDASPEVDAPIQSRNSASEGEVSQVVPSDNIIRSRVDEVNNPGSISIIA